MRRRTVLKRPAGGRSEAQSRASACRWSTPPTTAASSSSSSRPMAAGTPPASATPRPTPRASRSSTTGPNATRCVRPGRIPYAPFAGNRAFFEKYHRRMLVINGVDAQTNSHTVGDRAQLERAQLRGLSDDDRAPRRALRAGDLPVPYLSFGGYSVTSGLTRFTRIDKADLLREIANPATRMFNEASWTALESYLAQTAERTGMRRPICCRAMYATGRSTARRSPPRG